MKIDFPGSARPQFYDRNPSTVNIQFNASSISPHATTQRASTTVPSQRRGLIAAMAVGAWRDNTPSTVDSFFVVVNVQGGSVIARLSRADSARSAPDGFLASQGWGPSVNDGDVVEIITQDDSTAGSVDYATYVTIMLFDE